MRLPDSLYNTTSPRQPVMPIFRVTLRKTPPETLRPCLVCQVNREQAVHDEAGDDPQHVRRGLVCVTSQYSDTGMGLTARQSLTNHSTAHPNV